MIASAKEIDALNLTLFNSCINFTNVHLCNYCTKIFVIVVNTCVCRRSVDNKALILSCRRRRGNGLITELPQHYTNSHTYFIIACVNHMELYSSDLPQTKSGDSTTVGHQLLLPPLHLPLGQLRKSVSDNDTILQGKNWLLTVYHSPDVKCSITEQQ